MLVNGGGAVTLQFQRSPFKALTRTSYIPWNQIHVIEPVVMASSGGVGISWAEEDTSLKLSYSEPCLPHHFDKMKPLLFSSHQPSRHQGPPHQRTIFADSGVVQEAVQVPGSNIIIIIIITRPKPAFGRQGLAGSWGQDTDEVSTFLVFLTSHFAPAALSSDLINLGP